MTTRTRSRLYVLRIVYVSTSNRVKVRNIRDLTWADVRALQAVLHAEPSTCSTTAIGQAYYDSTRR